MTRSLYPVIVVSLGLIASQILSVCNVYLSNADLYHCVYAVSQSGYLPIPNLIVMERLKDFGPAFFGGLFFTFTIGGCLTLISFLAAWIWMRIFLRNKAALIFFLILWLVFLIAVNIHGFSLVSTSYFIVLPVLIFWITIKIAPDQPHPNKSFQVTVPVIFFIILSGICLSCMNVNSFLDIRDKLLLSTQTGKKVNAFYYNYCLYPARVFKSQHQRLVRICFLSSFDDRVLAGRIKKRLMNFDYLAVNTGESVDMEIRESGRNLLLINNGREIMSVTSGDFFLNTGKILKLFSDKCDRHLFFRQFTFFSLITMVSLTLFLCLYAPFRIITGIFFQPLHASVGAGIFCVITGVSLVLSAGSVNEKIDSEKMKKYLTSGNRYQRIAALKFAKEKKIDIFVRGMHGEMIKSPYVPERYWLTRALSISQSPSTFYELIDLLDDPHINIVCMAYYSLGQRINRSEKEHAKKEILSRIKKSDNWYIQGYAYKALRTLGWKQTGSK